ncbi:alpha/beta hydrolase [Micromonospora sp. NPDC049257]|uniref:alpha/beta fold hydrolase n=1 Tax=Micromonospora sp. NPDC049257 TaxID=3155771 RepID=UPI003423124C
MDAIVADDVDAGTFGVPGARLYYEVQGQGPVLLVLQAGEGDAGRTSYLVQQLADRYTVVTYDRRGLSRSKLDGPPAALTMETHADDASALLAHLTDQPAHVLGSGYGAAIGLYLSLRHPEQVRTLVAHEAPTLRLLPAATRERVVRGVAAAERAYHNDGWGPAMKQMAALSGIDLTTLEMEPGVDFQPMTVDRAANIEFFVKYDGPAFRNCQLDADDIARLKQTGIRVIPAGGCISQDIWAYVCAEALADELGTAVVEFPGGRNGHTTHPRAFSARLHEVLAAVA